MILRVKKSGNGLTSFGLTVAGVCSLVWLLAACSSSDGSMLSGVNGAGSNSSDSANSEGEAPDSQSGNSQDEADEEASEPIWINSTHLTCQLDSHEDGAESVGFSCAIQSESDTSDWQVRWAVTRNAGQPDEVTEDIAATGNGTTSVSSNISAIGSTTLIATVDNGAGESYSKEFELEQALKGMSETDLRACIAEPDKSAVICVKRYHPNLTDYTLTDWNNQLPADFETNISTNEIAMTIEGFDIWDGEDSYAFLSTEVTGDFTITSRISDLSNDEEWAKAGLMVRESMAADSANAMVMLTASERRSFHYRPNAGAQTEHPYWEDTGNTTLWARLSRSGQTITAETSPDGTTWTVRGTQTTALGPTAFVGIAAASHTPGTYMNFTATVPIIE